MSMNQKQDRNYLREDETALLQSLLQKWHEKPDKNTRDAFVTGTVLPQLQQLNLKEYGVDIISTDKVAKVRWEGRISVSHSRQVCVH